MSVRELMTPMERMCEINFVIIGCCGGIPRGSTAAERDDDDAASRSSR